MGAVDAVGQQVKLAGVFNDIGVGAASAAAPGNGFKCHRQVEAGVDCIAVRPEIEQHAIAGAGDGADGGLFAIVGAAYLVEQFGGAVAATVIDEQIVIFFFLRCDVARQLEPIARGSDQHEGAIVIAYIITALTFAVVDLE